MDEPSKTTSEKTKSTPPPTSAVRRQLQATRKLRGNGQVLGGTPSNQMDTDSIDQPAAAAANLQPSDDNTANNSGLPEDEETVPEFPIETLPMHILVKIIRYVPFGQWPRLESISRTFRDAMYETWTTVEHIRIYEDLLASRNYFGGNYVSERVTYDLFDKLAKRATNLTDVVGWPKIHLTSSPWRGFNLLSDSLVDLQRLRRLEIDGSYLELSDLAAFLDESAARHRLTELVVVNSIALYAPNRDPLIRAFNNEIDIRRRQPLKLETIDLQRNFSRLGCCFNGPSAPSFLQSIDVSRLTTFLVMDTYVPSTRLAEFLRRAIDLRRLSFSFSCYYEEAQSELRKHGAAGISNDVVRTENVSLLEAVGDLVQLESLTIGSMMFGADSYCDCRDFAPAIARMLRELGRHRRDRDGTPTFKELGLIDLMVTPEFVAPIAECLPNLESLTLKGDRLDAPTVSRVLRAQIGLKHLTLEDHQHLAIDDILRHALTLESLSLDFPATLTIVGDSKRLSQCRGLKNFKFVLRPTIDDDDMVDTPVDDSVLAAWAATNGFVENLVSLHVGGFGGVTIDGIVQLLAQTSSRLEYLSLENFEISDALLGQLPSTCGDIRDLRLSNCVEISRAGVQGLLDGYPRLKRLVLHGFKEDQAAKVLCNLALEKYRRILFNDVEKI